MLHWRAAGNGREEEHQWRDGAAKMQIGHGVECWRGTEERDRMNEDRMRFGERAGGGGDVRNSVQESEKLLGKVSQHFRTRIFMFIYRI